MNLERIKKSKVLVLGDIMLDRYIYGSVARISPEAPVPVVKAASQSETLGGAANVAHNIAMLGAHCELMGLAGFDPIRDSMIAMMDVLNIKHHFFDAGLQTTAKIRLIGERQQIVRIDYEDMLTPDAPILSDIYRKAETLIHDVDTVVLSDYGKGLISDTFCRQLIKLATAANKMTIVDPKGADWSKYTSATIITPNVKELSEAVGRKVDNTDAAIEEAGQLIRKKYSLHWLVVTRSEKGISIISESNAIHIPTQAQEVYDVSGAGDTVVATLACALGCGVDIREAVSVANQAAGIVVSKMGTVPVQYEDLYNAYYSDPAKPTGADPLEQLLHIIADAKKLGKKIVFTNGCFDILHRGHIDYIHKARKLGDMLVIGLNTDASVRRLKGESRPINNEADRAFLLSSLRDVDHVVLFGEDTPAELLQKLRPDILVKGGDYTPDTVIGREYAGRVEIIDFVQGYSTTATIDKMK
ncbi:MAG: bifunctional D-glycero-beta-D-manno-heptose-7-phosphate kinase/D-glycero-beta-D-manno-heptose 1-phosphate adenylyltransferase HldE [Deferribacteraceae bacterium]|jgi:D-beta-D-heptose 7-phosphate kinase/D-beta-D-heptose 1-phosphate adenosyltransferase|nr:bifunctional D-glycero-beta-D-manno-heptose-7-phosphate kinase/D-glycero-beta-D-manno-heptose 1-phosphate adenylyltransferase HldE [Deferribacteraceae bacterium]